MKRAVKWTLGTLLLIIVVGIGVPQITADQFGSRIQHALEASLGRKVKIGSVRINLFTGPGFTITDVNIYDDPQLSAEPILYTSALTAIPRVWPLFAGRVAFSSIRLDDAHINLGRTVSPERPARWNIDPLIRPAFYETFPNITVNSGRINFKIGGVKTVFYILTDKLEIRPPSSSGGAWNLRLEGEPARTDRPAHGFGSFVAQGRWLPGKGFADVTVRLERSEVGDIVALFNGHDAGVHGSVSGEARVAGPLDALKVNGHVNVRGLHGWEQLPSASQDWPLAIAGSWNLPGQTFELSARIASQPDAPVNAHFRVADYLGAPHWGLTLTCKAMPLQPLLPLARQIGAAIPEGVQLNGSLDGAISFSRTGPVEGSAVISNGSLAAQGTPPLEFAEAKLLMAGGHTHLAPAVVHTASDDDGVIEGDFDLENKSLRVTVTSRGMDIGGLRKHAAAAAVPLLQDIASGIWKGQLSYSLEAGMPPSWRGSVDITRASIALPMLAIPLRITSAHADLYGNSFVLRRIQARAGELALSGDYRYDASSLRQHKFHVSTPRTSGPKLEALLRPVLDRGSMVARALHLGRGTVPEWLAGIRAEGTVDIETFSIAGFDLDGFKSRLIWDGNSVKLLGAQARYESGTVAGRIDADLSGNAPVYHAAARLKGMAWKGGEVDGEGSIDSSGMGDALLANMQSEGSFRARDIDLDYSAISGCYQFSWNGRVPQLKLTGMQLSDGQETFIGSGATGASGELVLDLAGIGKPVRLSLR